MLILIAGLPGTGKTTVARALAEAGGFVHLNSDLLRHDMGLMGHYSKEEKALVYDHLLELARQSLQEGHSVVVDSTFYKQTLREPFIVMAHAMQVPLFWVETIAPEEELLERLGKPRPDSEADVQVYETVKSQFDPLPPDRLIIDTGMETPAAAAEKIMAFVQ